MMQVMARTYSLRSSLKKAQEVAALIRGLKTKDALTVLEHTPRKAAGLIGKQLRSAIANATNNHGLDDSSLIISGITVNGGGAIKRYRSAARGRQMPYRHTLVNIEMILSGDQGAPKEKKSSVKASIKSKPRDRKTAQKKGD